MTIDRKKYRCKCVVNAGDIAAMMEALTDLPGYEALYHLDDERLKSIADINRDNHVSNADLQALLDLLRQGGGPTESIPKPGTLTLLAIGLFALYAAYSASSLRLRYMSYFDFATLIGAV